MVIISEKEPAKPKAPTMVFATPLSVSGNSTPGYGASATYEYKDGNKTITLSSFETVGASGQFYINKPFSWRFPNGLPVGATVTVTVSALWQRDPTAPVYGIKSDPVVAIVQDGYTPDVKPDPTVAPAPKPKPPPPPPEPPAPTLKPFAVNIVEDLSVVSGKSLPGATISVSYNVDEVVKTTTANSSGVWSLELDDFVTAGFTFGQSLFVTASDGSTTSTSTEVNIDPPPEPPTTVTYTEEQERLLTRAITIVALRDSGKLDAVIQEMLNPTPLPLPQENVTP